MPARIVVVVLFGSVSAEEVEILLFMSWLMLTDLSQYNIHGVVS
jgi:hypothetical protein